MSKNSSAERAGIVELVERSGAAATRTAPLAWLRMEAKNMDTCELRLRLWPTGRDRLLATCGFHGQFAKWES